MDSTAVSLSVIVPVPVPAVADTLTVPVARVMAPKLTVKSSVVSTIESSFVTTVIVCDSPAVPVK